MMRGNVFGQLLLFVVILIALNFILPRIGIPIHISIIGSLVLTVVLAVVFGLFKAR